MSIERKRKTQFDILKGQFLPKIPSYRRFSIRFLQLLVIVGAQNFRSFQKFIHINRVFFDHLLLIGENLHLVIGVIGFARIGIGVFRAGVRYVLSFNVIVGRVGCPWIGFLLFGARGGREWGLPADALMSRKEFSLYEFRWIKRWVVERCGGYG